MQPSYQPRSTMSVGGSSSGSAIATGEIATHRASGEPIPVSEQLMQIDQAITLTLQEIDANFAKSHQIITGIILPSIKRYGIASHNTWQGAKFWHRFFETASDINLVPTYDGEGDQTQDQSTNSFTSQERHGSASPSPHEHKSGPNALVDDTLEVDGENAGMDDSGELDEREFEPPRLSDASVAATARLRGKKGAEEEGGGRTAWAPLESPFEKLKREVESDFTTSAGTTLKDAVEYHKKQISRDENDERQQLAEEIEQLSPRLKHGQASTTPKRAAGAAAAGRATGSSSRLATQVLQSQHEQQKKSARKLQATPRRGTANQGNPFASAKALQSVQKEKASRWNGIADLRKTPLAKVKAESRKGKRLPIREVNDDEDDSIDSLAWPPGMSPPVTMQFSVPRSKYNKTPAKEAARLVVDDLLRTEKASSPATRERLLQQRYRLNGQRVGGEGARGATPGGLVSTPLRKAPSKGRKSLPTPPTVTKRLGGESKFSKGETQVHSPAGVSSAKLFDEDEAGERNFVVEGLEEEGEDEEEEEDIGPDLGTGLSKLALTHTSASIDKLLEANEDDDDSDEEDSDSDSEEEKGEKIIANQSPYQGSTKRLHSSGPDYPTGSSLVSNSRSIDQDTLFGIRDPIHKAGPGPSLLKTASHFSSSSDPPTMSSSSYQSSTQQQTYQPMGARLYEQGTVYAGRPLIGDDREDNFSAPSPTPATASSRRSR